MTPLERQMLQIMSLDHSASVYFSEYTGKWFVHARIDIGRDGMLTGISEHAETPDEAVSAYFKALTTLDFDQYLVTAAYPTEVGARRHFRWNGAAFTEIPQ